MLKELKTSRSWASRTSLQDSQGQVSKPRMIGVLQSQEIFHWISTCEKELSSSENTRLILEIRTGPLFFWALLCTSAAPCWPERKGPSIPSSRKADEVLHLENPS